MSEPEEEVSMHIDMRTTVSMVWKAECNIYLDDTPAVGYGDTVEEARRAMRLAIQKHVLKAGLLMKNEPDVAKEPTT